MLGTEMVVKLHAIGGVPKERVTEPVSLAVDRRPHPVGSSSNQKQLELIRGHNLHCVQYVAFEHLAEDGRGLDDLRDRGVEVIETGEKSGVERDRKFGCPEVSQSPARDRVEDKAAPTIQIDDQLFHEQGIPGRALVDVLAELGRGRCAEDPFDHGVHASRSSGYEHDGPLGFERQRQSRPAGASSTRHRRRVSLRPTDQVLDQPKRVDVEFVCVADVHHQGPEEALGTQIVGDRSETTIQAGARVMLLEGRAFPADTHQRSQIAPLGGRRGTR